MQKYDSSFDSPVKQRIEVVVVVVSSVLCTAELENSQRLGARKKTTLICRIVPYDIFVTLQ